MRCKDVRSNDTDQASLQEEQERELSPEIEQERQLQRPPPAEAADHLVAADLKIFVSTGTLSRNSSAVMPAFETLRKTSASKHLDVDMFPKDILVTADFAKTVRKASTPGSVLDGYQRPVQWVLTSQPHNWDYIIIISPYEAQFLLPAIESSGMTTLHVYAPRPNLEIRPLDGLDLYTVPPSMRTMTSIPTHLKTQLNLFAGQLYFNEFWEYKALCNMLRLSWKKASKGTKIAADGFILSWPPRTSHEANGLSEHVPAQTSTFSKSPVKCLKIFLMKARRDCQSIEKTHLGKLLDGALLEKDEFFPWKECSQSDSQGTNCS